MLMTEEERARRESKVQECWAEVSRTYHDLSFSQKAALIQTTSDIRNVEILITMTATSERVCDFVCASLFTVLGRMSIDDVARIGNAQANGSRPVDGEKTS